MHFILLIVTTTPYLSGMMFLSQSKEIHSTAVFKFQRISAINTKSSRK